jgi:DNA-binding NarL/FixJ family response regulator
MEQGVSVVWVSRDDVSALGLPLLLDQVESIRSARVVRDVGEALRQVADGFDVAVVPLDLCGEFLRALDVDRQRDVKIMIAMPDQRHASIARALAHPVDGYLVEKECTAEKLDEAFGKLIREEPVISPEIALELMGTRAPGNRTPHPPGRLTKREREVLELLARGHSNQQIATRLGISIHAAKRHMSNLLVKFNCGNRTEVALTAVSLGIVSGD